MTMNHNVFIHETDRAAMEALQAIPGFSQVMKAFLSTWSEKAMYIENMATHIRIDENQFPQYDAMLKEVAAKMGIEKPDLFLKLDVVPNAYTSGETKPFIVITSGLLNVMDEELIPTVLAHECGHIVCHHVLYRTMGTWVLSGALALIPLGAIAIYPIMSAFHHWMRCSELSADRAAILYDGSADHLIGMCMRFAGCDKNIAYAVNQEAFMNQAKEYRKLVSDSKYNKTIESMRFAQATHPLNAVRALEGYEWSQSNGFRYAKEYFASYQNGLTPPCLPVSWNEKSFNGKDADTAVNQLKELGFVNVSAIPSSQRSFLEKENTVTGVYINEKTYVKEGDWISPSAAIEVRYYQPSNEKAAKRQKSESIRLLHSDAWYEGKNFEDTKADFEKMGFSDVTCEPLKDLNDAFDENMHKVFTVTVNGRHVFRRHDTFDPDAKIVITYHDAL